MKYDSVRRNTADREILMKLTPSGVKGATLSKEKILLSRKDNGILVTDRPAIGKTLYYGESIKHNWVITNEKETINGRECQKATSIYAGRNYEVWFTQEIPIPVGPYKFFGLPGLIVVVHDTDCLFRFELTSFEKLEYAKHIDFSTEGANKTTKKGIQQVYIDFLANPQFTLEAAGVTMTRNMLDKFTPKDPPVFIEILE